MPFLIRAIFLLLLPAMLFAGDQGEDGRRKSKLPGFVVVGDSLAAGFINFSLHSAGQQAGYAALVARQAGESLTLPLISYPGIPPALKLEAGQLVREAGIGFRTNPLRQAENLAVPGFTVGDILSYPFPGNPFLNPIDALSASILAVPGFNAQGCGLLSRDGRLVVSQLECAIGLKPKNVLVSAGGNDALVALTFGAPPTDPVLFRERFRALIRGLASTKANLVVMNIPNVAALPFLVPVPFFRQACPTSVLPPGTADTDFVVPNLTDPFATNANICVNNAVRPLALVAASAAAVDAYNRIIAEETNAVDGVVVDLYGLVNRLAAEGIVVNGVRLTTQYGGGLFSLDAIHPTYTGYAILANEIIQTMNSELKTGIPLLSLSQVAQSDPLFPRP